MDRTNDQRRTSSPNYNRPRDTTPYRSNSSYSSDRDNYSNSSSHYISSRSYSQNSDYPMRESPQAPPRYDMRDEESQVAFRGQVPFAGTTRDLKPYGRPPMLTPQSYDRRPPYRGGAPYHVPYSRPGVGGPPPHGHRDFGGPPPYSRGSPLHPPYQRPPFHSPFQRPHLPPHLPIFPPKRPIQNVSIFSPLHEKEISQSKQEDQRLRDEEWKLMVDLHKRRGELNKSTWEWTKVLHNTSLASQQMETLHTPEQIEALWKACEENATKDALKNHC
ncbi:5373_t:CDS:2 [Acaulospora morrowiae]|uniref:5373_t:CDS:1 n=1 Tax=Acaulospora morrowiae TaxID=94023 RepID=A0A9N8W8Y9_9GLOM|nr:5373_t:CDS:2 [Acaulospora morrowiae]